MTRRHRFAFVAAAVIALASSAFPAGAQQSRKYVQPYPRAGVLKLGESDRVIAWEVLRAKGAPSPMYQLPLDQVVVALTEGAVKFTAPDSASRIVQERFGLVRFESKGTTLQEEGLSDIPSRAIVFQLKEAPSRTLPAVDGIPGQFPRINAVKLFETDRINVWDQRWLPNQTIPNHLHYTQTVAVFLSGGQLRTRDLGRPWNAPFERHQGELLGVPPPRGEATSTTGSGNGAPAANQTAGATAARMVPHEEQWAGGEPRAIWIEFK